MKNFLFIKKIKIIYFLKEIINYDLYCKNVVLRIGTTGVTSTYYSKLITKIVFMIIIAYFVESLIQVFERKNLISNTTTRKAYPRPHISLNNNNFKFAFVVFDSNDNILIQSELERYYVPYFYMSILNGNGLNPIQNYSIIRNCTSKDFTNLNDEEYISYNDLIYYSCIDNFSLEINGFDDEYYFIHLDFDLDYCDSAYYSNCKPFEEITKKLQGGYLQFYILENDVDVDNYNNPFVSTLKVFFSDFFDLNKTYAMYEERFLKSLEVKTDQSFFFQDYISEYSFQLANEINYYLLPKKNSSEIYVLYIISYDKVDISTRNYDKIWNAISSLGGLMKIIIGLGILLTRKFNENEESINLIKSRHLINISSSKNKDDYNDTKVYEKAIDNNNVLNDKILLKQGNNIEISVLSVNRQEKSIFDYPSNSFNKDLSNTHSNQQKKEILNESIKNQYEKDYDWEIEIEQNIKLPLHIDLFIKKYTENPIINNDKEEIIRYDKEFISKKEVDDDDENNHKFTKNNNIEKIIPSSNKEFIVNQADNNDKNQEINFIKENFKKKYEIMKENISQFSFSFIEKIYTIIGLKRNKIQNTKNNIFSSAKKKLELYLDIDYIIEKLEEIEKLKYLLFNKNQLKIFNFLNKLPINVNVNEINNTGRCQEQTELVDLFKYLERKKERSGEINHLDNKFMKIIGQIIQS